ncbi:MAG: shikimate kinase [Candidatus Omnitrophica bacterium]|nr:shikimate kinase [Candidatus Omnitrophota bacterium]
MNNIYLVGFMASGKTTVGRELAKREKRHFLDLDDLIELKQGRRIADIFSTEGEAYFRKIEKLALKEAAAEEHFVFACGGGIIMDPDNLKLMQQSGKVICLSASVQTILKRTAATSHRPLLNVAEPKKQIELLLKLRAPYYAQADAVVKTDNLSVKEVVEKIRKIVSTRHKASATNRGGSAKTYGGAKPQAKKKKR